jgi:hypothetical protein
VVGVATPLLHGVGAPAGIDSTRAHHYVADEGDGEVGHMTTLIDGEDLAGAARHGNHRNLINR